MSESEDEATLLAQMAALQKRLDDRLVKQASSSQHRVEKSLIADSGPSAPPIAALVGESPVKKKFDPFRAAIEREQLEQARNRERKFAREARVVQVAKEDSLAEKNGIKGIRNQINTSLTTRPSSSTGQFIANLKRGRHSTHESSRSIVSEDLPTSFSKVLHAKNSGALPQPALAEEISDRFTRKARANIRSGLDVATNAGSDTQEQLTDPVSLTQLRKRLIAHDKLLQYLGTNYIIPPPDLYSLYGSELSEMRGPNSTISLKLDRGYVVVGVLASRSTLKISTNGKKYVIWKLVDFKTLPRDDSFHKQIHSTSREIALFCFGNELASQNEIQDGGLSILSENLPHGQVSVSQVGGAFAGMWTKEPGTLVALLNPVLSKQGHQSSKTLSLSISDEDQCLAIGLASQFGTCEARRKDGKRCDEWIDKRLNVGICDYHASAAIEKVKSGRVEFGSGSAFAMSTMGERRGPRMGQGDGHSGPFSKTQSSAFGPSHDNRKSADPESGKVYLAKRGDSRSHGQAVEDGFGREAARRSAAREQKAGLERQILQCGKRRASREEKLRSLKESQVVKSSSLRDGFTSHALKQIGFDPRACTLGIGITQQASSRESELEQRLQNRNTAAKKMKGETANRAPNLANARACGSSAVGRPKAKITSPQRPREEASDSDLELI